MRRSILLEIMYLPAWANPSVQKLVLAIAAPLFVMTRGSVESFGDEVLCMVFFGEWGPFLVPGFCCFNSWFINCSRTLAFLWVLGGVEVGDFGPSPISFWRAIRRSDGQWSGPQGTVQCPTKRRICAHASEYFPQRFISVVLPMPAARHTMLIDRER